MSPSNAIVLRRSPDWRFFDLENTRPFCTRLGFPESMIIDFARLWDKSMCFDYKEYRQQIKNLSLNNATKCRDAYIMNYENYLNNSRNLEDWYYFTDDDDWISPDAFDFLRAAPLETAVWGSVYIGRLYTDSETAKAADPAITFRNIDPKIFYTNNYCIKGALLERLGNERVVEHYDAQTSFDENLIDPCEIKGHLSAANKHPCCTMAILYNMKSDSYRNDVRGALEKFADDLEEASAELGDHWLSGNVRQFIGINRATLS